MSKVFVFSLTAAANPTLLTATTVMIGATVIGAALILRGVITLG